MLTSVFSNNSSKTNNAVAHILSRIDFTKVSEQVQRGTRGNHSVYTVVLFDYVHSGIYDVVAEMERIPGTTWFIHDALEDIDVKNALSRLFVGDLNAYMYTRRKIDHSARGLEQLTKYRQCVVQVSLLPSPILNPEQVAQSGVEQLDLYD